MSKTICFYLQLHAYGATGMADGSVTVLDSGEPSSFSLDEMRWGVKPSGETTRGSVTIVQPGSSEYPKVAFTGDFWRLIESQSIDEGFLTLCALDIKTAGAFVAIVEAAVKYCPDPVFFAGLVTADHTMSATIYCSDYDPDFMLRQAGKVPEDFELNEGNEIEFYFGAGLKEDIWTVSLSDLLEHHLTKAGCQWKVARAEALPGENEALKKAVRDLLAIAEGAVDRQETIDAARALLE